jgi:hypothetical protein
MAYHAGKTEHSRAKKGRGAFWGRKADAKKGSNRVRRRKEITRREAFESLRENGGEREQKSE